MKPIVRRILPSECPHCGSNSIYIYDKYGKRINYPLLCKYNTFDQIKKKFEKSDLKYMQCDNCKEIFTLDWTKKQIPYPVSKDLYRKFEI